MPALIHSWKKDGPVAGRILAALLLATLLLAAMLAGHATPASAQQRDEDEKGWVGLQDVLDSCLTEAKDNLAEGYACVGQPSRRCLKNAERQTTVVVEKCYIEEMRAWDALLNRYYRDRPKGERGTAMAAVQRSWIAYRDLKCGYFQVHHGGGSLARWKASVCMMEETGRRAVEIRSFRVEAN